MAMAPMRRRIVFLCLICLSVLPSSVRRSVSPQWSFPPSFAQAWASGRFRALCPETRRALRAPLVRRLAAGDGISRRSSAWLPCAPILLAGVPIYEPALAVSRTPEERQTTDIFRKATPSVVSIARGARPGERRKRQSADEDGLPFAVGSGFKWDANHVITNYHVLRDVRRDELQLIFSDTGTSPGKDLSGREVVRGELVGADPATDTAIIKILNATEGGSQGMSQRAPPLERGESTPLEVGQTVFAIGNPFGLEHSMSRGIVSGISRTLDVGERPIRGCIQTDASINPGNSGGPLIDSTGRVVGVNTAILSISGTSAGVGLAIPIDTVTRTVNEILKSGFIRRAFLGITLAPDEVSEQLQLPGVIVMDIVKGSPAEKVGVKPMRKGSLGDIVTALDGQRVRSGRDFFRILDKRLPGDVVPVQVQRALRGIDEGTEELTFNATLAYKDGFKLESVKLS